MEGAVVEGAKETIGKFRPVLYLENDRKEKSKALVEQLMALDYRLFVHRPHSLTPVTSSLTPRTSSRAWARLT